MNTTQTIEQVRPFYDDTRLPFEAGCAETTQLGQWVFEAVNGVEDGRLKPAGFACAVPPRALLGLIVYCYAAGIYASRDVESRLHRHDGIARLLCGPELLDRQTIRRFRRDNAAAVVWCLGRTLARTVGSALRGEGQSRTTSKDRYGAISGCVLDTGALATAEALAEARRRVERAVFLDSVALDE